MDAPKKGQRTHDALTEDQARVLLSAARGTPLATIVILALGTGLRRGEVLGLQWRHVDLDAGAITVVGTLKRVPQIGLVLDTTKTASGIRRISLPTTCVESLRDHRRRQLEHRLTAGPEWRDTGYVFTTPIGTPVDPRNLNRKFNHLTESAGLGRIRFHALRHSAATLMLSRGVPLEVISATLGHASYAITADVYARVKPALQRTAADAMDRLLAGA